ncbi:MAG: hypothetical protein DRN81_03650 [Thermoproteota archaeon]|nr:MAG: hypothetical protein DRN81_03650 [Candidatus Korarchaeota archaeon]
MTEGILIEEALDQVKKLQEWAEGSSKALGISIKESIALESLSNSLKRLYRQERDKWYKLKEVV